MGNVRKAMKTSADKAKEAIEAMLKAEQRDSIQDAMTSKGPEIKHKRVHTKKLVHEGQKLKGGLEADKDGTLKWDKGAKYTEIVNGFTQQKVTQEQVDAVTYFEKKKAVSQGKDYDLDVAIRDTLGYRKDLDKIVEDYNKEMATQKAMVALKSGNER